MSEFEQETSTNQAPKELPSDWLAMPFRDWCLKAGISVSHGYSMVAQGKLKLTKFGNRSMIIRAEHERVSSEGIR